MRRLFAALAAIVLVVSLGAPVTASTTGGGCTSPRQCLMTGQGADASWFGVPDNGPVPGVVYSDTFVTVNVGTFIAGGLRSTTRQIWFDRFTYTFDAYLNYMPISDTFGFGTDPDVSVTVAKNLSTATASGTVQATTCAIDLNWNWTCGDPFATTMSGTWTAIGARTFSVYTSHSKWGDTSVTSTFQGAQRWATALVTIGGVAPTGGVVGADVNDSRSNNVSICHGQSC